MKRSTLTPALLFLSALLFAGALQVLPAPALASSHDTAETASDDASACSDWKARHEEMKAKMDEMNQRLDSLVAEMNAATGDAKVDAVAAVVNELVAQRAEMHSKMKARHEHKCWSKCAKDGGTCGKGDCSKCAKRGECKGCASACAEEKKEGE